MMADSHINTPPPHHQTIFLRAKLYTFRRGLQNVCIAYAGAFGYAYLSINC